MFKNKLTLSKNRNLLSVLLSILIFVFIYIISSVDVLYLFDKKIQNLTFILNDINVSNSIVVIEIDDETLYWKKDRNWNTLSEWLWRYPFDRKYYWKLIDNLNEAWTAIIAFDIIFWEKSWDKQSDIESDKIFSNSIKNAWNVVLWLWTDTSWILQQPYKLFADYMYTSWYFAIDINKSTDTVYTLKPFAKFRENDNLYYHFTISILKWFYSKIYWDDELLDWDIFISNDKIIISDKIELLKSRKDNNDILINYSYIKENWRNKFNKLSFIDVYNNDFNHNDLKDKIVLVWLTWKWIKDIFNTPIWPRYWVYIHANFINTILTKNWIRYFDKNIEWLLIFLLIIVSVYFNFSRSSFVLVFSNIAIISLFFLWVFYVIILTNLLFNYPVELVFSVILSLIFSNIIKYLFESKNKDKLNKALSEYVSEDVAKEILSWEWKINLDWEKKDIAIFFSDIEWFTSISEKFTPEELVWFLREYLSDMSDIILDEWWFINKYEWDAIMALWWVFWFNSLETYNICLAALKQQQALKDLNFTWSKRGFSIIKTRIWIHYWSAIIWNIWSEWRKMEFTALWDSINLASRLEWVNKYYWTYICVSEDIYKLQNKYFEFRYLDKIKVKWKENEIKIYELLALKWKLTKKEERLFFDFRVWISLYVSMKFEEALNVFSKLAEFNDWPSITYKERCKVFLKDSPWENWDWIWIMDNK